MRARVSSARSSAYAAAARTRPGEQADVGGGLGVPLHRRRRTGRRRPPSPPASRRRRARPATKPGWVAHRLVVVAADREPVADQAGDPGAGLGGHLDRRRTRRRRGCARSWPTRSGVCWSRRAAGVHGHHLHAAADAEHRQAARVGGVEQRQLPGVPVRPPAGGPRVRLGAVPRRVDVGAAADDQAVEPGDHGVGGAGLRRPAAAAPGRRRWPRPRRRTAPAAGRRAAARRPTRPPRGRSSAR